MSSNCTSPQTGNETGKGECDRYPEVIAADITADLEAALEQFAAIAEDLK